MSVSWFRLCITIRYKHGKNLKKRRASKWWATRTIRTYIIRIVRPNNNPKGHISSHILTEAYFLLGINRMPPFLKQIWVGSNSSVRHIDLDHWVTIRLLDIFHRRRSRPEILALFYIGASYRIRCDAKYATPPHSNAVYSFRSWTFKCVP